MNLFDLFNYFSDLIFMHYSVLFLSFFLKKCYSKNVIQITHFCTIENFKKISRKNLIKMKLK